MRRPLVAVLALITALVAITGIGFVSLQGSGSSVSLGKPTAAQIKVAVNGISACAMEFESRDDTCLAKAYPELALTVGPQAVSAAYTQLRTKWPMLNVLCHEPAHDMGASVFRAVGDIVRVIENQDITCQGGYVHGAFDAWQETGPSRAAFVEAAQACNTFTEGRGGLCFDGLAHDLWLSYPDAQTVVEVCGTGSTFDNRANCLAGIAMQMYAPIHGEATNDLQKAVTEIPAFCLALPEWEQLPGEHLFGTSNNPRIISTCLASAPYPLATLLTDSMRPEELDPVLTLVGRKAVNDYVNACDQVAIEQDPLQLRTRVNCQGLIGLYLMNRIPDKPDLVAQYCRELLTAEPATVCLTQVRLRR